MKLLELCSGTGSVGEPFRKGGHDVVSVDLDGRYGPDICEDVLQLSYCKLETPDIIWASCPCENFSIARTRAKTPRNFALADSLVSKTWEIIQYFLNLNPILICFIENPDTSLLWARFPDLQPQVRLSYCSYGSPYRKNTRIATNAIWTPKALCDPATCHACVDGKHKKSAQRGPSKNKSYKEDRCTMDELHRLPKKLCEEIYKICIQNNWEILN